MRERGGAMKGTVISKTDAGTIQGQVKAYVLPRAILCTDEHSAYMGMPEYMHFAVNHSAKEYVNGMAHTNGLESLGTIEAWLLRDFSSLHHQASSAICGRVCFPFE